MLYEGLTVRIYEPTLAQLDRWLEQEVAERPRPAPSSPPRRRRRPPRASTAVTCEGLCPGCGEVFYYLSRGGHPRKYCSRQCAERGWRAEHREKALERGRRWRAANLEKARKKDREGHRRRAAAKKASKTYPEG